MNLDGKQFGLILADELKKFALIRPRAFEFPDEYMKAALNRVAKRATDPNAEFKSVLFLQALEHHERYWQEDESAHWGDCCLCLLLMTMAVELKVSLADMKLSLLEEVSSQC